MECSLLLYSLGCGFKMNWILGTALIAWLKVNSKAVVRVMLGIAIFFAIELIYSKFLDPKLVLSKETRTYVLIVYSLIQFTIIFWLVFTKVCHLGQREVYKRSIKESFKYAKKLEDCQTSISTQNFSTH